MSEGSTELIVKESLAYANSQPEAVDNELISLGPLTLSFLVSLPTLLLAGLRKSFIEFIVTIDPNNSFGFITLASWMEEGWVVFGIVLLFVAPSIILFLTAVIFIVLWLIKRFLAAREEKQKITCDTCQEMVYPTAIKCFSCKNELKTVCDIGLLGHVLKNKITDLNSHRFKLLSVQRCTICASKLGDNNIDQTCEICKEVTLSDSIEIKGYQDFIKKRLKKVLIVSTLLGLIPIVGSITTIVYSNLALVSPYSQYVSFSKGFMARFLAKIGIWFLLLLQSIPLAGAISCPLIVLIYYYSWNSSFKKEYVI